MQPELQIIIVARIFMEAMKSNYRYVHTEKVIWMANINDMWLKSSYGGGGRGKP